jgi:hypothetical protein
VPLTPTGALSQREILRIVNRYIGVSGGYLGDFSYRTHADFYAEYCNLDIDPYAFEGTTRERFITILSTRPRNEQAAIVRGVLERYPVGGSELRTQVAHDELMAIAERLERGDMVAGQAPAATSDVVRRALDDAEALLRETGATSAVDRVHTALHGHLRYICDEAGIAYDQDATTVALLKKVRREHPQLQDLGPRANEIAKILNAFGSVLDVLNPLRNNASVAHPNAQLLGEDEAELVINAGRTLLAYIDAKLDAP